MELFFVSKGIEVYTKHSKTYVDIYTCIWRVIQCIFNLIVLSFVVYFFREAWILITIAVSFGLFELFLVLRSESIILDSDQIIITKQVVFIKYFHKSIEFHELGDVFVRKKKREDFGRRINMFSDEDNIYSICISEKGNSFEIGKGINERVGRKMIEEVFGMTLH